MSTTTPTDADLAAARRLTDDTDVARLAAALITMMVAEARGEDLEAAFGGEEEAAGLGIMGMMFTPVGDQARQLLVDIGVFVPDGEGYRIGDRGPAICDALKGLQA